MNRARKRKSVAERASAVSSEECPVLASRFMALLRHSGMRGVTGADTIDSVIVLVLNLRYEITCN